MFNLIFLALYVLIVGIHITAKRKVLSKAAISQKLFFYFLVIAVAPPMIISGIGHVFFGEFIAPKIGWDPSPFEIEVGFHDIAWGLLAILAVKVRGTFCHATVLGWSFFMICAGINHYIEVLHVGNFAEYNFVMIFYDIGIALLGLYFWWKWMKTNNIRFWYKAA